MPGPVNCSSTAYVDVATNSGRARFYPVPDSTPVPAVRPVGRLRRSGPFATPSVRRGGSSRAERKEEKDMSVSLWEVDVPTKNKDEVEGKRIHVFVGLADSSLTARKAAHDAYDEALLLHRAGREIPRSFNWCARGLRPDWVLDWAEATAAPWENSLDLRGMSPPFDFAPRQASSLSTRPLPGTPGPVAHKGQSPA
jgi:hypothetical protein